MDYQKQIDIIKEYADKVQPHKVTVLTGKNGSGKSLLRKLVGFQLAGKLGKKETERIVASISMESRTQQKHDFGALRSIGIDDPENPTSGETLHNIDNVFTKTNLPEHPRFIVVDEPEIGMGEEMVAALVIKLNSMLKVLPEGCLGVMVITHNRYIVQNLNSEFLNLEGMNKEEWLQREIIPTNLEEFQTDSLELWRTITIILNSKKS